jgi:hypothetical protein
VTSEAGAMSFKNNYQVRKRESKSMATLALDFSVTREKGRGRVGSWQSQFANIGCNCLPLQPTIAAQLLLDGVLIEPYTIIIMLPLASAGSAGTVAATKVNVLRDSHKLCDSKPRI